MYYQVEIVYSFYIDLPVIHTLSIGKYSFFTITSVSLTCIFYTFHYIKIFHLRQVLILVVLDHSILSLPLPLFQILVFLLSFSSSSDSLQLKNQIISHLNPISCNGSLLVSSDSDCSKLYQNGWTSITVNEGLCNSMTNNLTISDNPCLESIVIKKNSLRNLNSLVISNNTQLSNIVTEDGEDWGFNGPFYNVKSVEISSIF